MKKGTSRGVLLLASMLAMLVAVGGVAWAVNWVGDNGSNKKIGTRGNDTLRGLGGNDKLDGYLGADRILCGGGNDRCIGGPHNRDKAEDYVDGGRGNDTIILNDKHARKDFYKCGPGFDTAWVDGIDRYYGKRCERVHVR